MSGIDFKAMYEAELAKVTSKLDKQKLGIESEEYKKGNKEKYEEESEFHSKLREKWVSIQPERLSGNEAIKLETYKVNVSDVKDNCLFYIPNFISEELEKDLVHNLKAHPLTKNTKYKSNNKIDAWSWKQLRTRMVLTFRLDKEVEDVSIGVPEYISNLFKAIENRVGTLFPDDFKPNLIDHVLINEYSAGQGIMPHTDGEAYAPIVFCLSLGSPVIFNFQKRLKTNEIGNIKPEILARVLLEPNSLIIFKSDLYSGALHGIDDVLSERYSVQEINNFSLVSNNNNYVKVQGGNLEDITSYPENDENIEKYVEIDRKTRISLTFRQEK